MSTTRRTPSRCTTTITKARCASARRLRTAAGRFDADPGGHRIALRPAARRIHLCIHFRHMDVPARGNPRSEPAAASAPGRRGRAPSASASRGSRTCTAAPPTRTRANGRWRSRRLRPDCRNSCSRSRSPSRRKTLPSRLLAGRIGRAGAGGTRRTPVQGTAFRARARRGSRAEPELPRAGLPHRYGMTMPHFILRRRIELACHLLVTSRASVTHIAAGGGPAGRAAFQQAVPQDLVGSARRPTGRRTGTSRRSVKAMTATRSCWLPARAP